MISALQSEPPPSGHVAADQQLHELAAYRRLARRTAAAVWFPLLVGGIATLAAPGATHLIGGAEADSWYWAFAGPAIGLACAAFYAARPVQLPARASVASLVLAVAMVAGAFAVALALGEQLDGGGPPVVVAAGLAVFAWLYRSSLVAVVAAAALGAGLVGVVAETARVEDTAAMVVGAVSCTCAIIALLGRDDRGSLPSERAS